MNVVMMNVVGVGVNGSGGAGGNDECGGGMVVTDGD